MRWIGQLIYDQTARFRDDIYLEGISTSTETDMLVVDSNNKVSKRAIDAITIDVSDFMTNGVDNRVLTATGTDAMNAEANLTFDGSMLSLTGRSLIAGGDAIGNPSLTITHSDADKIALDINAENTTANILDISSTTLTSGDAMRISTTNLQNGSLIDLVASNNDMSYLDGSNNTKSLIKLAYTKSGALGSGGVANVTGLDINLTDSSTNHASSSTEHIGVDVTIDAASDQGIIIQKGFQATLTDGDIANQLTVGYVSIVEDGGMDFLARSSADSGDYFSISTTTHGATTLKTVDDDATAAHFEVAADGNITLDAAGTIELEGNTTVTGDFTVSGTTTTVNTTNLEIQDKNITLNYNSSSDTSGTADGAGITIQDAVDASNDASLTWTAASDTFTFSHNINATLATAAQTNITSLGTLTALDVDDVRLDGKTISITGDTDDTFSIVTGASGATTLTTVDNAGVAGNFEIAADGNITLDAAADIYLEVGGADIFGDARNYEFSHGASESPTLVLINNGNDATGPNIEFKNLRDGSGLSANDELGTITWRGLDGSGGAQNYAKLVGSAFGVTHTDESGQLELLVTASDGTTPNYRNAFKAYGHPTADRVVVNLGYGTAGDVAMAGGFTTQNGGTISTQTDHGSAALTVNNNDVDQNALKLTASNTTANIIDINAQALTTGNAINIDANSLTTGNAIFLDIDDALTTTNTKSLIHIDYDKAGVTADSASTIVTGLDIDINDNATNHANSTQTYFGVTSNITWANDAGNNTGFVFHGAMSGGGGTSNQAGLVLDIENGGWDIKCRSSVDTGDYFGIKTTAHGATTLKTVDDDAAAAHFEIEADGNITLDAEGDIALEAAGNDISMDTNNLTITSADTGYPVIGMVATHTDKDKSGELRFKKDAADTEDGENLGKITWYGEDEGNNNTQFAGILAEISESDEGDEAGRLTFSVAESDSTTSTVTAGLVLEGEHATDGQIDVTIAAGAASDTTVAGNLTVTSDLTVNGDSVTFESANADDPNITIKNTTDDNQGARLQFRKHRGGGTGTQAVADRIGEMDFIGKDAGGNSQQYAKILCQTDVVTHGQESGRLVFQVAQHDGTVSTGARILGGDADDEIDVELGLGTGSTTTVAGDLNVTSRIRRKLSVSSSTDGDYDGDVVYFGGTTSMTVGKIYHYKSDGTWELANADAVATADGLLGVALGAASDTNGMLLRGMVTLDHDPGAIGDVLYVQSDNAGTPGNATATAPSASGDCVRVIGYQVSHASNGNIWFNPDGTFVEVA